MRCATCGTANPAENRFCHECGARLTRACPSCGSPIEGMPKFCGACGTRLDVVDASSDPAIGPPAAGDAPTSERRLVSVLFADLVGFTPFSESRDAEEVRELLSRYFDTCRTLIERYGGTVEKFIGDAVMAVWGTPAAKEDDAERAVRAALDLTTAVSAIGEEAGAEGLRARAGVLTGEAAVTLGATLESMVAGDLVNTASRIQAVAEPGTVYVGDPTRRASHMAIAYEDVGPHALKGKAEPVQLWRAVRVLAGVGGAQRSTGPEAPFVGRDRELRMIKELFHATAEERRPHLVSVVGMAGIGKSRLSWEFFKYIDGLASSVRWHRGRCLAYGEGVSYWALAEMVRTRADIVEGEPPATSAEKLRVAVEETIADPEERRWVEPRLASLLGLDDRAGGDQESLFSAWRLFYEHLSEEMPTVMVFEDMQWADEGLLDFVEYLLEWSGNHPLFVVTLARPEILDRRSTWGSVRRSSTSIYLEPLPEPLMQQLLTGLVPGLSDQLRTEILDRAEGVPLYAVETVRMLHDRGVLEEGGAVYRITGTVDRLDVPETLHALIAARLDGLSASERRLAQDASVLGRTFTREAIADLTDIADHELDGLLASLVRKEILSVVADRPSPGRGQYAFLQELFRRVAYETLAKRERKARHLSAASYIGAIRGPEADELVAIAASHLLEAYRLSPDAADALEIRDRARDMLVRAGERATAVAAHAEAQRYYDDAAGLTHDETLRAGLLERAGVAASAAGDNEAAGDRLERAQRSFEDAGELFAAARVSARLAERLWDRGRFGEAVDMMDRSYVVLSGHGMNADLAQLAAQLGRFLFFRGQSDLGLERIEAALDTAESLMLPDVLSQALNTKAVIYYSTLGRMREGHALLTYALEVAIEHDIPHAALRAYYNLADLESQADGYADSRDYVELGLALARRVGNRAWEWQLLGQLYPYYALGDWDAVIERAYGLPTERAAQLRGSLGAFMAIVPKVLIARGDLPAADRAADVFPDASTSDDVQEHSMWFSGRAAIANAHGDHAAALKAAETALELTSNMGPRSEVAKEAFVEAMEAAWQLGDEAKLGELLDRIDAVPRGKLPKYTEAHAMRFRARLAAAGGDPAAADERLKGAAGLFRELGVPFWTAVSQLELAERVSQRSPADGATLAGEAAATFERLGATPWTERARRVPAPDAAVAPAG